MFQALALGSMKEKGKWDVNKKCSRMENKGTYFEWKCITIVK